jgi:hypothetical protein
MVLSQIYKNIHFSGIIYVIDPDNPDHMNFARKDIIRLTSEDELRHINVLGIIFNDKGVKARTDRQK